MQRGSAQQTKYDDFVPDQYRTQEMCNYAVRTKPLLLEYVPDRLKTQKMSNKASQVRPMLILQGPRQVSDGLDV